MAHSDSKFFPFHPELDAIDRFALTACQGYNFGDESGWFFAFRGGLRGMLSRRAGADRHYQVLTEWVVEVPPRDPEHELSVCLFCMDSAIECWAFALNAIGFGVGVDSFKDVSDVKQLKRISPDNIIGPEPLPGYEALFPSIAAAWQTKSDCIRMIMDNHDISKHRMATQGSGEINMDVPPALLARYGVEKWHQLPHGLWPHRQVLLRREPKAMSVASSCGLEQCVELKDLKHLFDELMNEAPSLVLQDLRDHVTLPEPSLQ